MNISTIQSIGSSFVLSLAACGLLANPLNLKAQTNTNTVVEIAAANPDFSTLVAAVQAAGLAETLSDSGPFTVFAPNNAAFAKLPAGTVEALLQDTNKLRQILLYHVVSGRVRSTDLQAGPVATVQGATVEVDLADGVKINDAKVIAADVEAGNGVIHVIDTVLLPPDDEDKPSLVVSFTNGQISLVWPQVDGQMQVIEATRDLFNPEWTRVEGNVTTTNGLNTITLPVTVPQQFFRVRLQAE